MEAETDAEKMDFRARLLEISHFGGRRIWYNDLIDLLEIPRH